MSRPSFRLVGLRSNGNGQQKELQGASGYPVSRARSHTSTSAEYNSVESSKLRLVLIAGRGLPDRSAALAAGHMATFTDPVRGRTRCYPVALRSPVGWCRARGALSCRNVMPR